MPSESRDVPSQGEILYAHYCIVFAHRHPIPWKQIPTQEERDLWDKLAANYCEGRIMNEGER